MHLLAETPNITPAKQGEESNAEDSSAAAEDDEDVGGRL